MDEWLEAAYEDANGGDIDTSEEEETPWECPGCHGESGGVNWDGVMICLDCREASEPPWKCPRCGHESNGARWGSALVCLDCHEASLLPPESGEDYIGLNLLD